MQGERMSLTQKREVYKPFEYPKAFEFFEKQQQAHWLPTEVSMAGDINDWKTELNEVEKSVVGNVLKGFTQAEIHVEDYWSNKVAKWFKKPEIQMMANTFAGMEAIHMWGYSYLNDSLGLDDYAAFMEDKSTMAKLDRLKVIKGSTIEDKARSLAIFSGFTEGVHLFSSFAILLNFSRFNKLKGVGQIVTWSIRDESLHSEAGCWLFRQFCSENPGVKEQIESDIYEAARLTVKLEDDFIDMCFGDAEIKDQELKKMFNVSPVEGLDKDDLKQYIRHRTNTKLQDLGYNSNWRNIDKEAIKRLEWFDALSAGVEFQDFFAQRVTTYSKGVNSNWSTDYIFGEK